MLIHHTKPREDLLDGERHEKEHKSALAVMLALKKVRAGNPIKTVRVPK